MPHADWSTAPGGRWYATAIQNHGGYVLHAPQAVGQLDEYFPRLLSLAGREGTVLAGFDFPIGLPSAYAEQAAIDSFLGVLPHFGRGDWADFYELAVTPEDIHLRRPFYPRRPGGTRQAHLIEGLGLQEIGQLRRRCELPTRHRRAACPLFWTLGGNQVGRAAISGWRDLLAHAIRTYRSEAAIWPFDGDLGKLVASHRITVLETYPADQYAYLGFPCSGWSKRKSADRQKLAPRILAWIHRQASLTASESLLTCITRGFGEENNGEDAFDAVVGLLEMLSVVLGDRPHGAPDDPSIHRIEGWIVGQQPD